MPTHAQQSISFDTNHGCHIYAGWSPMLVRQPQNLIEGAFSSCGRGSPKRFVSACFFDAAAKIIACGEKSRMRNQTPACTQSAWSGRDNRMLSFSAPLSRSIVTSPCKAINASCAVMASAARTADRGTFHMKKTRHTSKGKKVPFSSATSEPLLSAYSGRSINATPSMAIFPLRNSPSKWTISIS